MKSNRRLFLWIAILLALAGVSCAPATDEPLLLASFTERYVDVSIRLERATSGGHLLSAVFVPPPNYHLYGKDIPRQGVGGLGRPTLLELTPHSAMKVRGDLTESVAAQPSHFEPIELLVYPQGSVTLSLPIELPPGEAWTDDEIQVTYMACSPVQCKPPVEGKIVTVRVPGASVSNWP